MNHLRANISKSIESLFTTTTPPIIPLTLPFLLLRLNNYRPETLAPFRNLLETKLRRLQRATSQLNIASYIKDISTVLQQPNCPLWLNQLYQQLTTTATSTPPVPKSKTSSPSATAPSPSPAPSPAPAPSNKRRRIDATNPIPLSQCSIWSQQIEYYRQVGLKAWTSGAVPYQISNSPALALTYATHIRAWLSTQCLDPSKPCYVLEFGAGHCKLGWHLTNALHHLQVPKNVCVVMCDLSRDVVQDRMKLPCFQTMLQKGLVDFACVDVSKGLTHEHEIHLLHQDQNISLVENAMVVVGNYFLDSLPIDMYRTVGTQQGEDQLERLCVQRQKFDAHESTSKKRKQEHSEPEGGGGGGGSSSSSSSSSISSSIISSSSSSSSSRSRSRSRSCRCCYC